jgi:hypothetical protein
MATYVLIANFTGYKVGVWHDDSIYLSTAKSVAEGLGYRHPEIPGNPWETKYPPLYAFMLAASLKVFGNYPESLPLLFIPNALFAAAAVALTIMYLRSRCCASRTTTIFTAVLTALSPITFSFTQVLMSEPLYALLSVVSLWFADTVCNKETKTKNAVRYILATLFSALSALTRSFGIALLGAVLWQMAVKRKWRLLLLACVIAVICLGPYQIWKQQAAVENGFLQTFRLTQYNLDYSLWLPDSISDSFRVVQQNTFKTIVGIGIYQIPWPRDWFSPKTLFAMHAISYSTTFLMITGFAATASRRWLVIHSYAVFYGALMLVWPFQPLRFLVPWTPFIFFWIFEGILFWSGWLERKIAKRKRQISLATALSSLFFIGVLLLSGVESYKLPLRFSQSSGDAKERVAMFDWIRDNIAEGDIIASGDPAILYLETGRKGFDAWPINDPYGVLYSAERSWTDFYSQASRAEMDAILEEMKKSLTITYARAKVGWVIIEHHADASSATMSFVAKKNPKLFTPVYSSPSGKTTIYRYSRLGGTMNNAS